ncbi:MAG: glycerol kinase, partial [Caulobacteraceae bacterium]|nr:glycerol kinase [Caulobacteraceae bacterium]
TTQRASALVWDRVSGQPLSPLVVWNDLRGAARAAELRQAGFFVVAQQAAAKLEAILAGVEAPRERLAWGNIDAWLIWKLTGGAVHATDRSQAWPTGYLNLPTMGWNGALIAHEGLDESLFPTLVDTWGPIGVTARSVLGAEIPITADIADQQSALLAHGGGKGVAKVTYGTSATLNVSTGEAFVFKSPTAPPFVASSVEGRTRFCLEGMVISAGTALDWLRRALRLGGHARFEALAASVPDAAGAAFLPALQGLGAPHGDAERRGGLGGLSPSVATAHLARAAFEGVAFRVREVAEHLEGLTPFAPEVLGVDGGLSASRAFLQVQADLLGRPIRRHATPEATACGAAIGAGLGAGLLTETDARSFIRYEDPVTPRIGGDEAAARFAAWRRLVYG